MSQSEARETVEEPTTEAARVVVLTAADAAPPSVLMRALGQKRMAAAVTGDEPGVMAELAQGPAVAVVLADGDPPTRARGRRELLAAVRRYHPGTAVWHYGRDSQGQPTLAVLGDAEEHAKDDAKDHANHANEQANRERQPPRRTPPASHPGPRVEEPTQPEAESETISEAELRMLLDPPSDLEPDPAAADGLQRPWRED